MINNLHYGYAFKVYVVVLQIKKKMIMDHVYAIIIYFLEQNRTIEF